MSEMWLCLASASTSAVTGTAPSCVAIRPASRSAEAAWARLPLMVKRDWASR
jgi:hypothetical protein